MLAKKRYFVRNKVFTIKNRGVFCCTFKRKCFLKVSFFYIVSYFFIFVKRAYELLRKVPSVLINTGAFVCFAARYGFALLLHAYEVAYAPVLMMTGGKG